MEDGEREGGNFFFRYLLISSPITGGRMSTYENEHPEKGADDHAASLGGADMSHVSDDGEKKHPLDARCDLLNQIGDQYGPGGAIPLLVLVVLGFITMHWAGVDDWVSFHAMNMVFIFLKPDRH